MSLEALENRQLLAAWGAQGILIGQDKVAAQFPSLTGAGSSIAIIDTGVDFNHPALGGGWGKKVVGGYDYISNDTNPFGDTNGHGTGTAAMAAGYGFDYNGKHFQGIAPGANIIALRESGTSGVDKALKWVIANKAKYNIVAVNFTDFGGGTIDTYRSMQASLATLHSMNVLVSSPAGNTASRQANEYDPGMPIVGSVNTWGGISSFTQRGPKMDFLAPGEGITLPYYNPSTKQHIYSEKSWGTSWSAPQIAGAAALLRQIKPSFTNAQIVSIIKDSATPTYDSVSKLTYPRLNLYGAVVLAYQRASGTSYQAPGGTQTSTPAPVGTSTLIQAEDFDAGVEGKAYHDLEARNIGNDSYRSSTGVDIVKCNDTGSTRSVGGTKAGEWVAYTINVASAGTYNVDFRVANAAAGGRLYLQVAGKNTGSVDVPNTGSWSTYQTVTKTGITLAAGKQTIYVIFERNASNGWVGDVNWLRLTKAAATTTVPTTPTTTTATGTPFSNITVKTGASAFIRAEDFDLGAEGVAYHDTDAANWGGQYRNTGVDIQTSNDSGGGHNLAFTKPGEWLNYTINVATSGTYSIDTRIAAGLSGATFHFEVDGKNVTGPISFTNTGSWSKWTTVRKSGIALTAGKHTLKLVIDTATSNGYAGLINWISIVG